MGLTRVARILRSTLTSARGKELFAMLLAFAVVAGCQPKGAKSANGSSDGAGSGMASIAISVPASKSAKSSSMSSSAITAQSFSAISSILSSSTSFPVAGTYFLPTKLSDFDCFAVNVLAPDISANVACGGDAQIGIAAGFVPAGGGVLSLNVPFGKKRTIQLWGFAHSSSCADVTALVHLQRGAFPPGANSAGFLLAQTTTDTMSSNMSINLYPSFTVGATPKMCGSIPPPTSTIDFVKYDLPGQALIVAGGGTVPSTVPLDSRNNYGVCIGFHSSASSPTFSCQLSQSWFGATSGSANTNVTCTSAALNSDPACAGITDSGGYVVHIPAVAVSGGLNTITTNTFMLRTTDQFYGLSDPNPPTAGWTVDIDAPSLAFQAQPFQSGAANLGIWFTSSTQPIGNVTINKAATVCVCEYTGGAGCSTVGMQASGCAATAGWSVCGIANGPAGLSCPISPAFASGNTTYTVMFAATDAVGSAPAVISTQVYYEGGLTPVITPSPIESTGNSSFSWPMGGGLSSAFSNFQLACAEALPVLGYDGTGACEWTIVDPVTGLTSPTFIGTSGGPFAVDFAISPVVRGGQHLVIGSAEDIASSFGTTLMQTVFIDNSSGLPGLGRTDENQRFVADETGSTNSQSYQMPGATGLNNPAQAVLDISNATTQGYIGYLFVADTQNSRVLVFPFNFQTFQLMSRKAIFVFGQPDFVTVNTTNVTNGVQTATGLAFTPMKHPMGVAVGTMNTGIFANQKKLWVSDFDNNRILQFDITGDVTTWHPSAELVLGQTQLANVGPNYNTGVESGNTSADLLHGMYGPAGLAFYNNRLYAADSRNCRGIVYDFSTLVANPFPGATLPITGQLGANSLDVTGGANSGADVCYNQAGSTFFGGVGQNVMSNPTGIAVDSHNALIYIADQNNNRVLVYSITAPALNATNVATNVIGQSNYTNNSSGSGPFDSVLDLPTGVDVYTTPGSPNTTTVLVTSQGDHTLKIYGLSGGLFSFNPANSVWNSGGSAASGPTGLSSPSAVTISSTTQQAFVADTANNRIKVYQYNGVAHEDAFPIDVVGHTDPSGSQISFAAATVNGPNSASAYQPTFGAFDTAYNRIYVSDTGNNRVLVYNADTVSRRPLAATTAPSGLTSPGVPTAVAVNEIGTPLIPSGVAMLDANPVPAAVYSAGANTLTRPMGIVVDSSGKLYVADCGNNRVLRFPTNIPGLSDGMSADLVLGQTDFTQTGASSLANAMNCPTGLAYDSASDRLYVADSNNARILIYDSISQAKGTFTITTTPVNYSCFGQNDGGGTTCQAGTVDNAVRLHSPQGMYFTQGAGSVPKGLFIADAGANRIMYYDLHASTTGMPHDLAAGEATVCYGQVGANLAAGCTGTSANRGSGTTVANGLNTHTTVGTQVAVGIYFQESTFPKLFVSDPYNERVGVYDFAVTANSPTDPGVFANNTMYHFMGAQDGLSTLGCGTTPAGVAASTCTASSAAFSMPAGIFGSIPTSGSPNVVYIPDQNWNRIGMYEVP